ncbi:MAG TPA: glycosyltransferase, partial [Sphingomicrobium sp.]|nr:glycosyltransferase [Sphingomicrobium sp.]
MSANPTPAGGGPGILYISYDGMLEPLGQSQVLAYLERLAPGRRIHLISFEKPADWGDAAARGAMRVRLRQAGIAWHPLRYHKSPSAPATAYDVAVGSALAIALVRRHQLGLVHARSYVAAAMALAAKGLTGAAFLFDMRGLWADERVDGGLWRDGGRLYRAAKSLERRFLLAADHVVTLTHASEKEIRGFDYLAVRSPPISVIPT